MAASDSLTPLTPVQRETVTIFPIFPRSPGDLANIASNWTSVKSNATQAAVAAKKANEDVETAKARVSELKNAMIEYGARFDDAVIDDVKAKKNVINAEAELCYAIEEVSRAKNALPIANDSPSRMITEMTKVAADIVAATKEIRDAEATFDKFNDEVSRLTERAKKIHYGSEEHRIITHYNQRAIYARDEACGVITQAKKTIIANEKILSTYRGKIVAAANSDEIDEAMTAVKTALKMQDAANTAVVNAKKAADNAADYLIASTAYITNVFNDLNAARVTLRTAIAHAEEMDAEAERTEAAVQNLTAQIGNDPNISSSSWLHDLVANK